MNASYNRILKNLEKRFVFLDMQNPFDKHKNVELFTQVSHPYKGEGYH